MNKKEHIEREIQKILDQFDQAEQLPPNSFFFSTRVHARLEEQRRQRVGMKLRPVLLMVLVALNLSTAIWYFSAHEQQSQADGQRQFIQILASDLMLENDQSDLFLIK